MPDLSKIPTSELLKLIPNEELIRIAKDNNAVSDNELLMENIGVSLKPKEVGEFLPMVGGTVGGVAAGIPGAAVGGALGEAGRQYISGEQLSPVGIAKEGALQGALEGVGGLVAKGVGKVLAPAAGRTAQESIEATKYFRKFGGDLSPAQITDSKMIDLAEGVAEASMTGGPKFFRFREGQAKAFDAVAEDLLERIGTKMDQHEVGILFADAIEKSDKAFRSQASALYKNVDSLTAGATVDMTPLRNFAQEKLGVALQRKGIGGTAAGDMLLRRVNQIGMQRTEEGIVFNPLVTFEEAQAIRSGFFDEASAFLGKKDKAAGLAKKFLSLTDEAMEKSAKELGDEAFAAWRKANQFYKEGKDIFQSKYIRGLTELVKDSRQGAEVVVDRIFKPGKETSIRRVKEALKDYPGRWDAVRGSFLEKMIHNATNVDGVILGKSFSKELDKMGEKTLSEIFTKQELNDILNVAKIARLSQSRPVGGGTMLVQLTQAGAIVGLISGQFPKSSATVLIGPYALSHIMTTPSGIKWLSEGFKTPAATDHAVAVAGRLIAEAIRSGNGEDIQIQPY